MSVVIRRTGYSYTWICKVSVMRNGKKVPCNHTEVVAKESDAAPEYEKHKKKTKGH